MRKSSNKVMRSLSLVLVLVMLFTLGACSEKEQGESTATTKKDAAESKGVTTKKDVVQSKYDENDPLVKAVAASGYFPLEEQVTVKMVGRRQTNSKPISETVFVQKLEDLTNVNIEWIDWPDSVSNEKKNLTFSSGELPDAFLGGWVLMQDEVVKYGVQGYLANLNEYLNPDVMPNVMANFETQPSLKAFNTTPDGNVYALPNVNQSMKPNVSSEEHIINTSWLEKVGKEVPTTTDELYDVLKAFKEAGDLNGNGKDDEIPFSFQYDSHINGMYSIMGWFGTAGSQSGLTIKNGKVQWASAVDDYKDALIFLNKLYEEDLLDKEAFTHDKTSFQAKIWTETPFIGIYPDWSKYQTNAVATNGDEYVPVAPLKSTNGNVPEWQARPSGDNNPYFAINADSEYIEILARWIDLWYDQEVSIDMFFGGPTAIEKVEEGVYKMIPDKDGNIPDWASRSSYSPVNFGPSMILTENFSFAEIDEAVQVKYDDDDAYYKEFVPENYYSPKWYVTAEEGEKLAILLTDIRSYTDQMTGTFVTMGGIEEGWDEYLKVLNDLKLDEMLEIYQGIYDRNQ